jgi:hypothetical protein
VDWVFAYGSLSGDPLARAAVLRGGRVGWGVAMDNAVAIPGYKVWEDASTGRRPDVRVAFVDLELDGGDAEVEGALVPAPDLPQLDRRERQYRRVDVSARVHPAPADATVWAYVGRPEARARARRPPVVVPRAYLALLPAAAPAPPFPVVDLVRVDLPG